MPIRPLSARRRLPLVLLLLCLAGRAAATGEVSTYFEIFVPPNNDAVRRDVALILTAIYDSTTFEITDDGRDGDTDDSVSGMLMSGQSYILYMREGSVNDDANAPGASGAKQDGDFFTIRTSNLVMAFQSCDSDWQHDWVPATNKSSKGTKYILYAPKISSSKRDINVFAYADSTQITIRKISTAPKTTSGYTDVDPTRNEVVVQRLLNVGEDLIFYHTNGRDLMETGATYVLESNKPVTVQCGALWGNARDGGGYVPSDNGSSAGELFYFTVHYQAAKEQEIRIVSWDNSNTVYLDRYLAGNWVNIRSWTLNALQPGDWISTSGNIDAVFRVRCGAGKKVSVFEANWLETGSPGTSDIGTMASGEDGTSAGRRFLIYLAPPGNENNVTNPATGLKYTKATHAYVFSRKNASITVKDAQTGGSQLSRTYSVQAGYYVDVFLTEAEWQSIYNGNGNPASGAERPYIIIESDQPVSVFNTNFNDNWMAYFGTSQTQDFGVQGEVSKPVADPGETIRIGAEITLSDSVQNPEVRVVIGDGATVIKSDLINETEEETYGGRPEPNPNTGQTIVYFDSIPALDPGDQYRVETDVVLNNNYASGDPILNNTVVTVETVVSGDINGTYQQATTSQGITNQTVNRPPPLFFRVQNGSDIVTDARENLGIAFGDYNNDGFQDLYLPAFNSGQTSLLYKNDGSRRFTRIATGPVVTDPGVKTAASWGDYDNDGDLDLAVSYAGGRPKLYRNDGNGVFRDAEIDALRDYSGSCYNTSWVDLDNDGFLDLFFSDLVSNRPNVLFRNDGQGDFVKLSDRTLDASGASIGAGWCDYDNDGDQDLFVPNSNGQNNFLFRNEGEFRFTRITEGDIVNDGGNSTGCSWGDYDNDGDFDLFVANASNEPNFLYRNLGNGSFEKVTTGAIVSDRADSQGSAWGDYDNDGDLDLIVTNADGAEHYFYVNNGDGSFSKNTTEDIASMQGFVTGVAHADIDNDGDLDVFAANHFNNANYYFVNNGTGGKWLEIKLVGTRSNKRAIGATVRVKARIGGRDVWMTRHIAGQTGGGPGAQSSLVAHFGLGSASKADSILVIWPSGYRQFERNVNSNQLYTIIEDEGIALSGQLYFDADSSCSFTPGDAGIPGLRVRLSPGNISALTDSAGAYTVRLNPGTYTVSALPDANWRQICPASPATYTAAVSTAGGNATYRYASISSVEDCSWGCTRTASGSSLTIGNGEQVCVPAGATFSGSVTFNGSGTLVICGTATVSSLNFNGGGGAGKIIISSTGRLNLNNLNLNSSGSALINYSSTLSLSTLTVGNGVFENFGTASISNLNLNNNATLLNTGTLTVGGGMNVNGVTDNYGTIRLSGNLVINNNGELNNYCTLTASGNATLNGSLLHGGYLQVAGQTIFSNGGPFEFRRGALLTTGSLTVNEDLTGPDQAGASIRVSGNTALNSGAVISGYIDLCDANGIETFNGSLSDRATSDCSRTISGQPCDNGLLSQGYTSYDFAFAGQCTEPDLRVSLGTTGLRLGFTNPFTIDVANAGPERAEDVELRVTFNTHLDVKSASIPWQDSIPAAGGLTYRWNLGDLDPLAQLSIEVVDSVRITAPFGELVATSAAIRADNQPDCDSADNTAVSLDEVVGSYDPNDKLVFPVGAGANHYILGTDTLYYKIRFQNVGNYLAGRVIIFDTLSEHLDWGTFVPGPMSHDGYVLMSEDGVLVWTFNNINLPDSGSNEALSHGFVQFKILPRQELPYGTRVENSAAIQFDFNELIYTNTVFHTISDRLTFGEDYKLAVQANPNPVTSAKSSATVYNLDGTPLPAPLERLDIYTPAGVRVISIPGEGRSEIPIPYHALTPGFYFLKAVDLYGYPYTGNMEVK